MAVKLGGRHPSSSTGLVPMPAPQVKHAGVPGPSHLTPRLLDWAQHVLVSELVSPGDSVCHIFCGRGRDAPTWLRAKIWSYSGVDFSESALQDAREAWDRASSAAAAEFSGGLGHVKTSADASRGKLSEDAQGALTPPPHFFNMDPCLTRLEPAALGCPPSKPGFDIVCCSSHVHDCFLTEATAKQFASNVGSLLRPGGYFFGLLPDSSSLWYKFQKASDLVAAHMKAGSSGAAPPLAIRSSQYVITFESSSPFDAKDGSPYGIRYFFRFADEGSLLVQPRLMVHFPTFIRLLEATGLEYIDIQNLDNFYDDHRLKFHTHFVDMFPYFAPGPSSGSDSQHSGACSLKAKISQSARDLLGLHAAHVFRKRLPVPQAVQLRAGGEGGRARQKAQTQENVAAETRDGASTKERAKGGGGDRARAEGSELRDGYAGAQVMVEEGSGAGGGSGLLSTWPEGLSLENQGAGEAQASAATDRDQGEAATPMDLAVAHATICGSEMIGVKPAAVAGPGSEGAEVGVGGRKRKGWIDAALPLVTEGPEGRVSLAEGRGRKVVLIVGRGPAQDAGTADLKQQLERVKDVPESGVEEGKCLRPTVHEGQPDHSRGEGKAAGATRSVDSRIASSGAGGSHKGVKGGRGPGRGRVKGSKQEPSCAVEGGKGKRSVPGLQQQLQWDVRTSGPQASQQSAVHLTDPAVSGQVSSAADGNMVPALEGPGWTQGLLALPAVRVPARVDKDVKVGGEEREDGADAEHSFDVCQLNRDLLLATPPSIVAHCELENKAPSKLPGSSDGTHRGSTPSDHVDEYVLQRGEGTRGLLRTYSSKRRGRKEIQGQHFT